MPVSSRHLGRNNMKQIQGPAAVQRDVAIAEGFRFFAQQFQADGSSDQKRLIEIFNDLVKSGISSLRGILLVNGFASVFRMTS